MPSETALITLGVATLAERGAALIVACRFIPGGRTAVTITCGATSYPRRAFVGATAAAGVLWAGHAFALGRAGGKAFHDRPWAALLLALAVAVSASGLIEAVRRLLAWREQRLARLSQPEPAR